MKTTTDRRTARLNIYVPDSVRRRVKRAAADLDVSVSDYCLEAIEARLRTVEEPRDVEDPVRRARAFRARAFSGEALSVSTAELLRQDRARR